MSPHHYFAPGAIDAYRSPKVRNARHLARWLVRVIVWLFVLSFASGLVRGCIVASAKEHHERPRAKVVA